MSIFDGQTFIGLDDDALAPDQPLDTWAHHVMRAQGDFNIRRGARCHHAPYSERSESVDTERVYASATWTSPFLRRLMIEPRCEAVRMHVLGRVDTRDATVTTGIAPVVDARLELGEVGRVTKRFAKTTDFEALELELLIPNPPARRAVRELSLWTRSNLTQQQGPSVAGVLAPIVPGQIESSSLYPVATYPGPDTYADQATLIGGVPHDHLWQPAANFMDFANALDFASTLERWSLSWLAIRGIWIEMDHAPRVWAVGDTLGSDMRGGIIEEAEVITSHAQAALARYRGARLHHLGPRGGYAQGGSDQEAYGAPLVWGWTDANEATEEFGATELFTLPMRLDEAGARVTAHITLAAMHATPSDGSATLAELYELATSVGYVLNLEVSQLVDASQNPTSLATAERDVALDHLPTSNSGRWPLLRTARQRYEGNATHDAPSYREGQLYEADRELLVDVSVSVDVTGADLARPALVTATLTRSGEPTYRLAGAEQEALDRLQICVVGVVLEESHP